MDVTELRIGNKVDLYGSVATIQRADFDESDIGIAVDKGKPIELKGAILLKSGFEKVDHIHGYSFYSLKRKRKERGPSICIYDTYTTVGHTVVKHCEFVHQLQNLYRSLNGKEINIKI